MPNLLAKDHWGDDFDGPSWVPFNLWMIATYGKGRAQKCALTLIYGKPSFPSDKTRTPTATKDLWGEMIVEYGSIDGIAHSLPHRCAESLARWEDTPKLTPREFADSRMALHRHAVQLAKELEIFVAQIRQDLQGEYDPGRPLNFTQFMTEAELAALDRAAMSFTAADRPFFWEVLIGYDEAIVPDMPTLLRRVGDFFLQESQTPPIDRPHSQNAKRNEFMDDMIGFFTITRQNAQPAIVAEIVSLFFEQGVTNNDVSQRKKRHPAVRRRATP